MTKRPPSDVVVEDTYKRHRIRAARVEGKTIVICKTCKETLLEGHGFDAAAVITAIENHT